MKRILITHSDLDAIGCMIVAKMYDDPFDIIKCMNYDEYENESFNYEGLERFEEIVYADFSPDVKSLEVILKNKIKTIIYDHHDSFYSEIWTQDPKYKESGHITYIYDKDRCGTKIYFDRIKSGRILFSMQEFVTLVDTYDLWKWKTALFETAISVNRIVWKYANYRKEGYLKYSNVVNEFYRKIKNNSSFTFNQDEKDYIVNAILKEKTAFIEAMKNLLVRTDKKGYKFGITKVRMKISLALFNLLRQRQDLSYVIGINTYNQSEGELKLSIRSLDTFDCLQLQYAKGHKNACGSENNDQKFISDLWFGRIYELGYKDDEDHKDNNI